MEQNRYLRNKHMKYWQLIIGKTAKAIQWRKETAINGAGTPATVLLSPHARM
jgi:hypothetical protein